MKRAAAPPIATDREGRLKLLDTNVGVFSGDGPQDRQGGTGCRDACRHRPCPILSPTWRAGSPGTTVYSAPALCSTACGFRVHLAQRLEVSPVAVEAQVVGEHGTSEVLLWSSARVSGVPIAEALQAGSSFDDFRKSVERDVRYANITIIEGNEASQFGIGIVSARIAEAVLRNKRAVLPIGVYHAKYGVTLSLPSVVGREGVNRVLEPAMSDEERRALSQSAEVLRQAVQRTAQIP